MKYNWRGVYDVFSDGLHLYTVDKDEVNLELDLWRWRGYEPVVNDDEFTIEIKSK